MLPLTNICSGPSTNESCESPLDVDDVRTQSDPSKLSLPGEKVLKKMRRSPLMGSEQDLSTGEKEVATKVSI